MAASTFSYAQAAKGLSTSVASSKPTSGAATPAKDAPTPATANGSTGPVPSWADDAENESATEQSTTSNHRETQSQAHVPAPAQSTPSIETPSISSPDLGASSSSTVTKDDDVSSLPNASSESTWDNKSQASTSVDKTSEPAEKTSEKVKKGKNVVSKPLQEAPLPAVNIWKKRADEYKFKTPKPSSSPLPNGVSSNSASAVGKKNDADSKGQPATTGAGKSHARDEEKSSRRDARADAESKKDSKNKFSDKETKPAAGAQLPPPKRDEESWPTPETVIHEDRKKAQEKGEKEPKEQKEGTSASGKHEWVKVPYTPSVVFNTPLPNAANTRRGGRGGARGGSQAGGRPTTNGANGTAQPEKDGSAPAAGTNGDHPRRERTDGAAPRDASPKSKRTNSAASPTMKEQAPVSAAEKPAKITPPPGSENDFRPRTAQSAPDSSQSFGQNGSYSRQYPSRPNKPRRGDASYSGERRRDGDVSPTKDSTFDDRRTSSATQTDPFGEGDRRASTYYEGSNGHQSKGGRYSSYSAGRGDRGRGGSRGGRGNYANGHQYTNGHMASQSSSSFTMSPRSPTTFNPENPSFFSSQGKYSRNAHRSQSVTTDPYRFAPYQAGPPVAPLQTSYGMYDYSMMQQPMSAVPYAPYVDQYALLNMMTTQVEYYFSLDNLLKDMFLRRRMDSQGFVPLDFIAGFNRIKHLSTDIELIKLVCQQSSVVQYRTGEDGQDRLRRREGWEQWVLDMKDRDTVAQNDGPKELRYPPAAQPILEQTPASQWPMSPVEPSAQYGNHSAFPQMNGFGHAGAQDTPSAENNLSNGATPDDSHDGAPNGHPVETATKAVSPEPDSFSDAQITSLTVVVRKQGPPQSSVPLFSSRTLSNGSVDSNHVSRGKEEDMIMCSFKVNVSGTASSNNSNASDVSPSSSRSASPARLYWVKNRDGPVHSIPQDSAHESYLLLRSNALQQRRDAPSGTTPYDMDILYQFWSHFLLRNFNLSMYDDFHHFALEDATEWKTNVGLSNLIKFYSESLLSSTTVIRELIAQDYVQLVKSEHGHCRPGFQRLRSIFRTSKLDPRNRQRICNLLDQDWLASLLS